MLTPSERIHLVCRQNPLDLIPQGWNWPGGKRNGLHAHNVRASRRLYDQHVWVARGLHADAAALVWRGPGGRGGWRTPPRSYVGGQFAFGWNNRGAAAWERPRFAGRLLGGLGGTSPRPRMDPRPCGGPPATANRPAAARETRTRTGGPGDRPRFPKRSRRRRQRRTGRGGDNQPPRKPPPLHTAGVEAVSVQPVRRAVRPAAGGRMRGSRTVSPSHASPRGLVVACRRRIQSSASVASVALSVWIK